VLQAAGLQAGDAARTVDLRRWYRRAGGMMLRPAGRADQSSLCSVAHCCANSAHSTIMAVLWLVEGLPLHCHAAVQEPTARLFRAQHVPVLRY
jgi:hypothetical protein